MIASSVQFVDNTKAVVKAAEKASFRNFGHAAATIRKDVLESIVPSDEPSAPGEPPHTRNRGLTKKGTQKVGILEKAITFDATKEDAVVGPRASVVGPAGALHEFGGSRGGADFPERPYMLPALLRNLDRFHQDWQGSIQGG